MSVSGCLQDDQVDVEKFIGNVLCVACLLGRNSLSIDATCARVNLLEGTIVNANVAC